MLRSELTDMDTLAVADVDAFSHTFGEELNCINRANKGFFLEYRWVAWGRYLLIKPKKGQCPGSIAQRGLHCVKRSELGKECGASWFAQQLNPKPCEEAGCEQVALNSVLTFDLTRATKWSRIRAASILPRNATRPNRTLQSNRQTKII
jgi:hypothetical protein